MKASMAGLAVALALAGSTALAQQKEVTIGYQDMLDPYRHAQETKELEKATGYKINWKQFGGGGEVIKAMASGGVQLGEVGSAGIAAAVSRGEPYELFWILDDIGDAEALVAKNGSGINTVADLKGKKVAINAFGSAVDLVLRVALKKAGLDPRRDVQIVEVTFANIAPAIREKRVDCGVLVIPFLPGGVGAQQAMMVYVLRKTASAASVVAFGVGMQVGVTLIDLTVGVLALLISFRTLALRDALRASRRTA